MYLVRVYFVAKGYYEVLLLELKYNTQLLEECSLVFRDQLPHAILWSLTKDYQGLIVLKYTV